MFHRDALTPEHPLNSDCRPIRNASRGESIVEYILPIGIVIILGVFIAATDMSTLLQGQMTRSQSGEIQNGRLVVRAMGSMPGSGQNGNGEEVCIGSGECFSLPEGLLPGLPEVAAGNGIEKGLSLEDLLALIKSKPEPGSDADLRIKQYLRLVVHDLHNLASDLKNVQEIKSPTMKALSMEAIKAQYSLAMQRNILIQEMFTQNNPLPEGSYEQQQQQYLLDGLYEVKNQLTAFDGDFDSLDSHVAEILKGASLVQEEADRLYPG
jgi:hypothetical protein